MNMKRESTMRILRCDKHRAKKQYKYYLGFVNPGDFYYRGFAITETGAPFEFMFTDATIYHNKKIAYKILADELRIYYTWRKQTCN